MISIAMTNLDDNRLSHTALVKAPFLRHAPARERERERERESVCVCDRERERERSRLTDLGSSPARSAAVGNRS